MHLRRGDEGVSQRGAAPLGEVPAERRGHRIGELGHRPLVPDRGDETLQVRGVLDAPRAACSTKASAQMARDSASGARRKRPRRRPVSLGDGHAAGVLDIALTIELVDFLNEAIEAERMAAR